MAGASRTPRPLGAHELLYGAGLSCVVAGAFWLAPPVGLIALGLALCAVALVLA